MTSSDQLEFKPLPDEVLYFTSRLEIGKESVYRKLEKCTHFLNNPAFLESYFNEESKSVGHRQHQTATSMIPGYG